MKNVTIDIYPDKWITTITIGNVIQRHVFENGPTEAKHVEQIGDEFPPEVQDWVDTVVGDFQPFHIGDHLRSIE